MKFNNDTLRDAVREWIKYETSSVFSRLTMKNPKRKYGHISNWDTSEVTNMSEMFYKAKSFNQPLESWNIVSLKYQCEKVPNNPIFRVNLPAKLTLEDTSKEEFISQMFYGADSFNQSLEKWKTN